MNALVMVCSFPMRYATDVDHVTNNTRRVWVVRLPRRAVGFLLVEFLEPMAKRATAHAE